MIDFNTLCDLAKCQRLIHETYYNWDTGLISVNENGIFLTADVFQKVFNREDCTVGEEEDGVYWRTSFNKVCVYCFERPENRGWYYGNFPIDN